MKWHRIKALLLKYYYITIHRVDRLFDLFYWPLVDLVIWGFTSSYIKEISDYNILSMILGGVILWLFVWRSSQDIAVFVLEDFWSENLYHLFSSPVKLSEHAVSIIIFGFLRTLVSFFIMAFIAFAVYSFNIFSINLIFIAVAVALLSIFAWAMGLFITGLIFRFGQRIQVLAWSVIWLIQPFSCVFYPLSSMPPWGQTVAKLMPTTYIFENLRSLITLGVVNYGLMVYSLLVSLILVVFASLYLNYAFRHAKKTGLIAKCD